MVKALNDIQQLMTSVIKTEPLFTIQSRISKELGIKKVFRRNLLLKVLFTTIIYIFFSFSQYNISNYISEDLRVIPL